MEHSRQLMITRIAAACVAVLLVREVSALQQKNLTPRELALSGCGDLDERHLLHDGLNRSYLVYRPCHAAPRAILLSIHCFGGNAQDQVSPFIPDAEKYGFVLLAPVGVGDSFNAARYCCGQAMQDGLDDRGFIKALADLENERNMPVFSFGFSNGGYMTSDLAMAYPGWLKGAAMASGHNYEGFEKLRSTPVMLLWKEHDAMVLYNGCCSTQAEGEACCCGISSHAPKKCVDTPGIFQAWQRTNNCKSNAVPLQLMGNVSSGLSEGAEAESRGDAKCMQGGGCSDSTVLCTYAGSIHGQWATPPDFLATRVAGFFGGLLTAKRS